MYLDIPDHIVTAISWTVIHSIWQVSIIALVMSVILNNTPIKNASRRYKIGLLSLAMVAITSGITFCIYAFMPDSAVIMADDVFLISDSRITEISDSRVWFDNFSYYLNHNGPLITQIWIIGVLIFGIKFLLGYAYIFYLNYLPSLTANPRLENILQNLINKMNVTKSVIIAETHKVASPLVTGYLKPIILFPLSMSSQLSTEEVEIIVAHELAHIIRNDWLVNLLQSVLEIVFYFHPGVWWISAHIREERENSCDDIALQSGYGHLSYAKVLVKLREMQLHSMPSLAMSFFNSKNSLMNRIRRLLGQPQNRNIMREKIVALALVFTVAIAFAGTKINKENIHIPFLENDKTYLIENGDIVIPDPAPLFFDQDTIPPKKKRSTFTLKKDMGKSYHIETENGEIKKLEIDGEIIPPEKYDEYMDELSGDENWKFNFNEDGSFGVFDFDHALDFDFEFDENLNKDWKRGLEELSERLGEMDFGNLEDMEWDNLADEMRLHRLEIDSLMNGNIWIGRGEHMDELQEMLEKLQEMEFGEQEGLRNLERLHEMEGFGEMFKNFNFAFPEWKSERHHYGGTANDHIARELNEDGLIKIGENNEIELSGKHLKINGEKQPTNIWEKYKSIYEDHTGMKLTKDSKVKFDIIGKESNRGMRRI